MASEDEIIEAMAKASARSQGFDVVEYSNGAWVAYAGQDMAVPPQFRTIARDHRAMYLAMLEAMKEEEASGE